MTTVIKTQCPHCQTCFNVHQDQLNKVNAIVNCEQCQESFLVNQHLIVTPDAAQTATAQPDITATSTSSQSTNKKQIEDLSSDDLIHDDMDIDEPSETIVEYDSLDSMDAWLTQANHAPTAVNKSLNNTTKATNKSSHSSAKPSLSTNNSALSSTAQPVISSVAANDIHASVNHATDNAWLEELLKEQNKREEPLKDDTDLSQLLLDMGVPLKDDIASEEYAKKSQTQAKFAPTSEKQSIASLLWVLGCLVLALLLFAQYVIFNLENLVKNPVYAERLQTICSIAVCSLPSADLNALTVTTPNHRSSQVEKTGAFSDVSATLNNQSAKAQLYPNLKVSVYGANEMIGEFIAAPEDYLLSKQSHLAANSGKQLLFTIPVANAQIREVTVNPLY